jgi:hypothetical protein
MGLKDTALIPLGRIARAIHFESDRMIGLDRLGIGRRHPSGI